MFFSFFHSLFTPPLLNLKSILKTNMKTNKIKRFILIAIIFNPVLALSKDKSWSSESEAGLVVNSGNAESQSVSFKTLNKYKLTDKDELVFKAEYFQSEGMVDFIKQLTSENTLVELKYSKVFHDLFGAFIVTSWSKDNFRGFENRFEVGPGLSYHFIKSEHKNLYTEHGYLYRQETEYEPGPARGANSNINFYRAYFEGNKKFNPTLSGKLWLESKLNIENTEDIEVRVEPSLSVMLTGNFSLGLAYRYSFDNVPASKGFLRVDTMYMTTLKAKF